METYTREQLIIAQAKYNKETLENPDSFVDIDDSLDCAEAQVDYLISFIEK